MGEDCSSDCSGASVPWFMFSSLFPLAQLKFFSLMQTCCASGLHSGRQIAAEADRTCSVCHFYFRSVRLQLHPSRWESSIPSHPPLRFSQEITTSCSDTRHTPLPSAFKSPSIWIEVVVRTPGPSSLLRRFKHPAVRTADILNGGSLTWASLFLTDCVFYP